MCTITKFVRRDALLLNWTSLAVTLNNFHTYEINFNWRSLDALRAVLFGPLIY